MTIGKINNLEQILYLQETSSPGSAEDCITYYYYVSK